MQIEVLTSTMKALDLAELPSQRTGIDGLVARALQKILEIDREKAIICVQRLIKAVELGSAKSRPEHFKTLEEYIRYRSFDVGYE